MPNDVTRRLSIEGRNNDVSNTGLWVDIWEGGIDVIPEPSPLGETINVVSTNVNDTLLGTGAQVVRLEYLNTLNELISVNINMSGTTPSQAIGITNMTDVIDFYCIQNGTNKAPLGDIIVFKQGNQAILYDKIIAGGNKSQSTLRHLLPTSTFYITSYFVSSNTKGAEVSLRATCNDSGEVFPDVYLYQVPLVVTDAPISINVDPAIIIPGTAKMKVSAKTSSPATKISVWLNGYVKI
ncbi:hypothetical protein [Cetobacterium sp.]|uniref:hypothetical protein n=1 Tax=Cetobacterium sp. TaxID=2071632 RepID=UPI003F37BE4A